MLTYPPAISVLDGPETSLLSVLWILIEVLHVLMRRGKTLTNLKFGTFIGRFSSDDAVNMAVKGLKVALRQCGYTRAYFPRCQTGCRYTLTYLPKERE